MSKATVTVEGFAAEPRKSNANGKDVTTIAVGHTPRRKNRQTDEWEDAGPTTWFEAAFWEDEAAAVAQAVSKGTLVTLTGQPELNVFTKQNGETGASIRLKFATLGVIPRVNRQQQVQPQSEQWAQQPQADAWAQAGGYGDADTPF